MELSNGYWDYVGKQLEEGYGKLHNVGHPQNWEEGTINAFLSELESKVQSKCKDNRNFARSVGIPLSENKAVIEKWRAIDSSVFRKIFITKKTKRPQTRTKNQFAIYLDYESWTDLYNKNNLSSPPNSIKSDERDKVETKKIKKNPQVLLLLCCLAIIIACFIGFKIQAKNSLLANPKKSSLQSLFLDYAFDCSQNTNLKEAIAMLKSIGVTEFTSIEKGNYCSGMLNPKTEITIWLNDYEDPKNYGFRFGNPDKSYFGSNKTYFTIPKCF